MSSHQPLTAHHQTPTGWFVALVVLCGVLYVAWRTGRLGALRSAIRDRMLTRDRRHLPEGVRIRPVALVPTLVLVIVIVVLVLFHSA